MTGRRPRGWFTAPQARQISTCGAQTRHHHLRHLRTRRFPPAAYSSPPRTCPAAYAVRTRIAPYVAAHADFCPARGFIPHPLYLPLTPDGRPTPYPTPACYNLALVDPTTLPLSTFDGSTPHTQFTFGTTPRWLHCLDATPLNSRAMLPLGVHLHCVPAPRYDRFWTFRLILHATTVRTTGFDIGHVSTYGPLFPFQPPTRVQVNFPTRLVNHHHPAPPERRIFMVGQVAWTFRRSTARLSWFPADRDRTRRTNAIAHGRQFNVPRSVLPTTSIQRRLVGWYEDTCPPRHHWCFDDHRRSPPPPPAVRVFSYRPTAIGPPPHDVTPFEQF